MSSLARPESSRMTLKMTFPHLKASSHQISWGRAVRQRSPVPPPWCSESVVLPGHRDIDNPTAKHLKKLWLLLSSTHWGEPGAGAGTDCRCSSCGHRWPAASFYPPPASESFPCLTTQMGTYTPHTHTGPPHTVPSVLGVMLEIAQQTWEGAVEPWL